MVQPFLPARWTIAAVDAVDDPSVYPAAPGAGFLALKTPIWSTIVATSSSGRERRQQLWSYPRWTFEIPYEVLRDQVSTPEIQKLWAFFNSHAGQAGEFFLRDATDCAVSEQAFGVGDGVTTSFQLCRTMGAGQIGFTEPVFGISGVPSIFSNGASAAGYVLGEYGEVTFIAPPAAGVMLTWTGQFLFLVRFATDQMDTAQVMAGAWSSGGVTLMSLKR